MTNPVVLMYCVFVCVIIQSRGLEFHLNKMSGSQHCGKLTCSMDTKSNGKIFSIIRMTIFDISQVNVSLKLASASVLDPDLYVNDAKKSVIDVQGSVSQNQANLDIRFSNGYDCASSTFMCELNFINRCGKPDFIQATAKVVATDANQAGCGSCEALASQLAQTATQQKERADQLNAKLVQLTNRVADIERKVDIPTSLPTNLPASLPDRVALAEKKLDYLLNRGHCYRGMPRQRNVTRVPFEVEHDFVQKWALCDPWTDNFAWIIVQRRTNGAENFNRTWREYVQGFGSIEGDYWLGLQFFHYLSNKDNNELWVAMTFMGTEYNAVYYNFRVGNESSNFAMSYEQYHDSFPLAAGDSFASHQNIPFSTYDRDNDNSMTNCAADFHGGWWYNDCYDSNLNGKWGEDSAHGMIWKSLAAEKSLTFSEIKIGPYAHF